MSDPIDTSKLGPVRITPLRERTEAEVIRDAYAAEHVDKIAPVQGYPGGIPWPIHLEAYEAYVKRYGKQTALINLADRGCRGGFGTEELDLFVPGWRDRVTEFGKMKTRLAELEAANDARANLLEAASEALGALSAELQKSGWLDKTSNWLLYDAAAKSMISVMENEQ